MMRGLQYVLVLVVGFALTVAWMLVGASRPLHLYDADLNRLAVTYQEGVCAGTTYVDTRGRGDPQATARCRAVPPAAEGRPAPRASEAVELDRVLPGFCGGVIERGWEGTVSDCVGILVENRMWPTYDGRLSVAFGGKYPWPGDRFSPTPTDDSERVNTRTPTGNDRGF